MAVGNFIFGEQKKSGLEVLDLRHFDAAALRPLLRREVELWQRNMAWDYAKSVDLLLEYIDGRVLPGFVATDAGRVQGYAFGVLEGTKAVIGDAYAYGETGGPSNPISETLLEHLIEMLQATPGVDRIESQLLLFPAGALAKPFLSRGFRAFPRLFMVGDLDGMLQAQDRGTTPAQLAVSSRMMTPPRGLRLQAWRPEFYDPAADLIHRCYIGHIDGGINDQYRSAAGSQRFLHNIIRFPGCGVFDAENSWLLLDEHTGRPQALSLSSVVRNDVAHVTQVCVSPSLRGAGLGRLLLLQTAREWKRRGGKSISLTVTEANTAARSLYETLGYRVVHRFEAMVWDKSASRDRR
jgi:ribosomal protein S18 acetylase RimI-like enzyme